MILFSFSIKAFKLSFSGSLISESLNVWLCLSLQIFPISLRIKASPYMDVHGPLWSATPTFDLISYPPSPFLTTFQLHYLPYYPLNTPSMVLPHDFLSHYSLWLGWSSPEISSFSPLPNSILYLHESIWEISSFPFCIKY